MHMAVPTIRIAPSVDMPLLGLGTGPPYTANDTYISVLTAVRMGYTAIDTAHNYRNQPAIARAIAAAGVQRKDIFITSKVPGSLSHEETLATADQSLKELETNYIDLLLVHFPCPSQPYNESAGSKTLRQVQWRAMEVLVHTGRARAIGVSHHCQRHMEDILEIATVPIAANQVEYHVGMAGGADAQNWMQGKGINLLSFLPLCGQCDDRSTLISGPLVSSIGRAHNRTGAQVSLRWLVQSGVPAIPRSKSHQHLMQNMQLFDFSLTRDEMAMLNDATHPPAADGPEDDCKIP